MYFAILLLFMCLSLYMGVKEDFQLGERRSKLKENESYKVALRKLLEEEKMLEDAETEKNDIDKHSPDTTNQNNETV